MQPAAITPADSASASDQAPGTRLPTVEQLLDEGAAGQGSTGADTHSRLPMMAVPGNIMLQSAVGRLVEQKERIDQLVRDGLLAGLLPAEWSAAPGNELRAFVASVVPFASDAARGDTQPARVPLRFLLGHSQRWCMADVAEPHSLAAYLHSDARADSSGSDPAEVMLLASLGLAWAHSGRSRVGFLRAMDRQTLAARVTVLPYPEPERLALYQANIDGVVQSWCVLDKRRLRALAAPSLSLPLLAAYGVQAPKAWPGNWPAAQEVATALAQARGGKGVAEVDLVALAERIGRSRADDAWANASLMQLNTWVPRWRVFLASFIGLPATLLLLAGLALPGRVEAAVVAAALGFAGGAIAALAAPWVHARRRHLS